jgi:hypothetical protein
MNLYEHNRKTIEDALSTAPKRAALASSVGVSEGQLSKLLNGEIHRFCQILEQLGLQINHGDYMLSLERVLQEKLKK